MKFLIFIHFINLQKYEKFLLYKAFLKIIYYFCTYENS